MNYLYNHFWRNTFHVKPMNRLTCPQLPDGVSMDFNNEFFIFEICSLKHITYSIYVSLLFNLCLFLSHPLSKWQLKHLFSIYKKWIFHQGNVNINFNLIVQSAIIFQILNVNQRGGSVARAFCSHMEDRG